MRFATQMGISRWHKCTKSFANNCINFMPPERKIVEFFNLKAIMERKDNFFIFNFFMKNYKI